MNELGQRGWTVRSTRSGGGARAALLGVGLALAGCGGGGGWGQVDSVAAEELLNASVVLPPGSYMIDEAEVEVDEAIELAPPMAGGMGLQPDGQYTSTVSFSAPAANVVGAGMRFGSSGPIHVVPIPAANGQSAGSMSFDFQIPANVCADLGGICHDIKCYEFAVTDVGQISRANIVQLALACGNCTEPSCQSLITDCELQSPFQGSIAGSWSGTCDGDAYSGTFQMTIAPDGSVTGSYAGDDVGDITGTVDSNGNLQATGGGDAGGCGWSGQFSGAGATLAGSGGWSCDVACAGSWSGS